MSSLAVPLTGSVFVSFPNSSASCVALENWPPLRLLRRAGSFCPRRQSALAADVGPQKLFTSSSVWGVPFVLGVPTSSWSALPRPCWSIAGREASM